MTLFFRELNNHTYFRTLEANNLFGDFSSNFCRRSKGFRFHSDVRECFTIPQERAKQAWEGDRYKWNTRNSGAINAANDKSLAIL